VPEISVHKATPDDVRTIQVRRRADEATLRLSLELADDGGAWIARDDGEIIGLALASVANEEAYIGELFVEPSFRGQGIGGQLLDAAFEEFLDANRMTAADLADAASVALAIRRGLAVVVPIFRFAGAIPKEDALARMAAGEYRFEVDAIHPRRHGFGLDALDRECRGAAAPNRHERFAPAASGHAFFLRGEFVAYAYVWPDGRVGPLAVASASYFGQIFAFALAALRRTYGASWCTVLVPGTNVRACESALRAGLRLSEPFVVGRNAPPPAFDRYVGFHRLTL
jgi:GNAT superfamily N-acetyltransferase